MSSSKISREEIYPLFMRVVEKMREEERSKEQSKK